MCFDVAWKSLILQLEKAIGNRWLITVGCEREMSRLTLLLFFVLITIIILPLFLAVFYFDEEKQTLIPGFFVGVEYAVANHSVEDCKALVDRTKNFTNLFVIDSFGITSDFVKLDEICDYVYDSGLYFLVFFISPVGENENDDLVFRYNFYPHIWISNAKEKYGEKFLGIYAMDEPGGSQLDQGPFKMILSEDVENAEQAADVYVYNLYRHVEYYTHPRKYENITVLTADYGLYWFDYKAGYDTILTEFGWNHSRQLHVALCRGAANVQRGNWGMIETWTYNQEPYLTSWNELYSDLFLAYHNGAKYAVIFDHPDTDFSEYGILTEEHFVAMEDFWNYVNRNPGKHGIEKATVAYVLPEDFGYAFRNNNDKLWGKNLEDFDEMWGEWTSVELAEKVCSDIEQLLDEYGSGLDIVYSDPEFCEILKEKYEQLFFWNQTLM